MTHRNWEIATNVFVGRSKDDTVIDHNGIDFDELYRDAVSQIPDPTTKIMFFMWICWDMSFDEIAKRISKSKIERPKNKFNQRLRQGKITRMTGETVRIRLKKAIDAMKFCESDYFNN